MVRQREIAEFRTPQHPSLGTNNWGGASPLLARNVPNESLEQRYQRLNSVRNDGEIFTAAGPDGGGDDDDDDDFVSFSRSEASKYVYGGAPSRGGLSLVRKLARRAQWKKKKSATATVTLSSTAKKKKKWFGRWDPKNRWPQGWC